MRLRVFRARSFVNSKKVEHVLSSQFYATETSYI